MMISNLEMEELNQSENLFNLVLLKINEIFEKRKHIYVFLDRTLDYHIFDEIIGLFKSNEIEYISLGIQKEIKSSNLILLRINDKVLFNKVVPFLVSCFVWNINPENDSYVVCGFGSSDLELDDLIKDIKKKLIVKDGDREIIFRWYDPRVMIYLNEIFSKEQLKSIYLHLQDWTILHPTGMHFLDLNVYDNTKQIPIKKLSDQQSIALDLIGVSNTVYQQLYNFEEEIDVGKVKPIDIYRALFQAYDVYKIQEMEHLIAYGLYSQILHPNFMKYRSVIEHLKNYWVNGDKNFAEAMEIFNVDLFEQIQQDFRNGV